MYDPDKRERKGVTLACRAAGKEIEAIGKPDLSTMTPPEFREVIKAAIVAWETQRFNDDIPF